MSENSQMGQKPRYKQANKQNNVWSFVLESERVTWSKIMVVLLIGICS